MITPELNVMLKARGPLWALKVKLAFRKKELD